MAEVPVVGDDEDRGGALGAVGRAGLVDQRRAARRRPSGRRCSGRAGPTRSARRASPGSAGPSKTRSMATDGRDRRPQAPDERRPWAPATVDVESAWSRLVPSTSSRSVLASGSPVVWRHAAHRTPGRYDRARDLLLLVDLDGVVYRGADPVPGRRRGPGGPRGARATTSSTSPTTRCTTAPTTSPASPRWARRSRPRPVVSSARATALYLARARAGDPARARRRGERPRARAARRRPRRGHGRPCGHADAPGGDRRLDAAGDPDAVVVGLDPKLTYLRLAAAARLHPGRRAVHRHQPRPGLPDRARPPARGRERRRRGRGGHRASSRSSIGKPGPHLLELAADGRRAATSATR